jgi:hypothetical protein
MKRLIYQGVKFGVGEMMIDGEPGRLLQFWDEKVDEFIEFPMTNEDAKNISDLLIGDIKPEDKPEAK